MSQSQWCGPTNGKEVTNMTKQGDEKEGLDQKSDEDIELSKERSRTSMHPRPRRRTRKAESSGTVRGTKVAAPSDPPPIS
jgi:hypothetical protein